MGSVEFAELKAQMDRIEGLLSRLTGGAMPVPAATVLVDPVATVCYEDSHRKSIQDEGRFILQTQGLEAYQRFWKEQAKRAKSRPRRRAA